MVEHTCENCKKKFTRKDAFNKHINRKNPCTGNSYKNIVEKSIEDIIILLNRQTIEMNDLKNEVRDLRTLLQNKSI